MRPRAQKVMARLRVEKIDMKRRDFITLLGGATTGGRMAVRVNRQRAGTGRPQ
jgi:hypothetical protein